MRGLGPAGLVLDDLVRGWYGTVAPFGVLVFARAATARKFTDPREAIRGEKDLPPSDAGRNTVPTCELNPKTAGDVPRTGDSKIAVRPAARMRTRTDGLRMV
jgi:hypothetical protein